MTTDDGGRRRTTDTAQCSLPGDDDTQDNKGSSLVEQSMLHGECP